MADNSDLDVGEGVEISPPGGASIPPPGVPKEVANLPSVIDVGRQLGQYALGVYKAGFDVISADLPDLMEKEGFARAVSEQVKLFEVGTAPLRRNLTEVNEMQKQTIAIADGIQRLTGLNALALERGDFGLDNLGRKMAERAMDATNKFKEMKITLVDGTEAWVSSFGEASEIFESFADSALDDTKLFVAATEGMNENIIKDVHLAKRNMGLSAVELNQILNIELAKTGKISGDFLKEFEKTTIATAEATGLPAQLVTNNLNRMLADFNHFGNMTLPQMGSLTNTISRLGVEMTDVTRIADKFSSFDSAAQAVSNLAATTGVTLDTLDLFEKAASGDIESFIEGFREQLDAQGLEFENLNFMQQKQIAAGFGIDPRVMQKLMNDNLATIESATAEIEAKSSALTDEQAQALIASMARLDSLSPEEQLKRQQGMATASLEYAATVEKGYLAVSKAAAAGIDAVQKGQDVFVEQIKLRMEIIDKMSKRIDEMDKKVKNQEKSITDSGARYTPAVIRENIEVPAPASPPAPPAAATPGAAAVGATPAAAVAEAAPTTTGPTPAAAVPPAPAPTSSPAAPPASAPAAGTPTTTGAERRPIEQSGVIEEFASLNETLRGLASALTQPTRLLIDTADPAVVGIAQMLSAGVVLPGGGVIQFENVYGKPG
jgi:hypothetical protein